MGKVIDVILLEDLDRSSHAGHTKTVSLGHARNYLIPYKKAVLNLPEHQILIQKLKAKAKKRDNMLQKEAESIKLVIDQKTVKLKVNTNEEGHLYGSVGAKEVVDLVKEQFQVTLKKEVVVLKPIKELGRYSVTIDIFKSVAIVLFVVVESANMSDLDIKKINQKKSQKNVADADSDAGHVDLEKVVGEETGAEDGNLDKVTGSKKVSKVVVEKKDEVVTKANPLDVKGSEDPAKDDLDTDSEVVDTAPDQSK